MQLLRKLCFLQQFICENMEVLGNMDKDFSTEKEYFGEGTSQNVLNRLKELTDRDSVSRLPAFYVLLLFCIGFNVFLLINWLDGKMSDIKNDVRLLKENTDEFEKEHYYDFYVELDMEKVCEMAKGRTVYDSFTDSLIRKNYAKLQAMAGVLMIVFFGVGNLSRNVIRFI